MQTNSATQNIGLAILRATVGLVFMVHGWQKLFVYGFGGVASSFAQMGIPLPTVSAVVVTLVEFLGGLALIVGLYTRCAALLLAINMLVAVLKVHLPGGFFLPRGYEFALTLLGANLGLVLIGPGKLSLDWLVRKSGR